MRRFRLLSLLLVAMVGSASADMFRIGFGIHTAHLGSDDDSGYVSGLANAQRNCAGQACSALDHAHEFLDGLASSVQDDAANGLSAAVAGSANASADAASAFGNPTSAIDGTNAALNGSMAGLGGAGAFSGAGFGPGGIGGPRLGVSGASGLALADAVAAAPEPSSLFLLGSGLAGLAGILRRKIHR